MIVNGWSMFTNLPICQSVDTELFPKWIFITSTASNSFLGIPCSNREVFGPKTVMPFGYPLGSSNNTSQQVKYTDTHSRLLFANINILTFYNHRFILLVCTRYSMIRYMCIYLYYISIYTYLCIYMSIYTHSYIYMYLVVAVETTNRLNMLMLMPGIHWWLTSSDKSI